MRSHKQTGFAVVREKVGLWGGGVEDLLGDWGRAKDGHTPECVFGWESGVAVFMRQN
jgi:hypothetical protein